MDKDTRKVLRAAEHQGFEVRRTATGHRAVFLEGHFITEAAGTLSDKRHGLKNLIAALRRAGFQWPPRR